MLRILAPTALLPTGWTADVLLEVDEDGSIRSVTPDVDPTAAGEAVPAGGIVVPGVPNLHSHAFQRAMAGLAERSLAGADDDFWGWREVMYRFLRGLGPDEVEAVATRLYVEMLEAGYTSVVEFHYLHLDPDGRRYDDPAELSRRHVAAARRAGIGLTLLPVLYRAGGFGGEAPGPGQRRFVLPVEGWRDLLEALRPAAADDPELRLGIAPHSLRAVPPGDLEAALEIGDVLDPAVPVHIHVAEQTGEVAASLRSSGRRPVAWLLDHAPVDERWCLVHATHVDGDEIDGIAGTGAVVGLCPTTEANLGDGRFPLPEHLATGGRFGIGSDSHVSVSPVEELRWLEYGQRLALGRRNVAARAASGTSTGAVLLRGALAGGRRASGRPVGRLAPGSRADLLVLDPDHPDFAGREGDALVDAWIFSGSRSPVRHVMVGGRWVVRDGRHPLADESAAAYRRTVEGLLA